VDVFGELGISGVALVGQVPIVEDVERGGAVDGSRDATVLCVVGKCIAIAARIGERDEVVALIPRGTGATIGKGGGFVVRIASGEQAVHHVVGIGGDAAIGAGLGEAIASGVECPARNVAERIGGRDAAIAVVVSKGPDFAARIGGAD